MDVRARVFTVHAISSAKDHNFYPISKFFRNDLPEIDIQLRRVIFS